MGKYKVCPTCRNKNSPTLLECELCETDLSGVKVLDEALEQAVKHEEAIHNESNVKMVRICECGFHNSSQARKCSECDEEIADIQPTQINEGITDIQTATITTEEPKYSLVSLDGIYAFVITKPLYIIGRENDMSEYLQSKPYVSRTHAKLTLVEDELYITDVSKTNFTYVNNEKLVEDTPRLLQNGDEIALGGVKKDGNCQEKAAYFIVNGCSC